MEGLSKAFNKNVGSGKVVLISALFQKRLHVLKADPISLVLTCSDVRQMLQKQRFLICSTRLKRH